MFIGADLNVGVGTENRGDKRWHGGFDMAPETTGDEILKLRNRITCYFKPLLQEELTSSDYVQ